MDLSDLAGPWAEYDIERHDPPRVEIMVGYRASSRAAPISGVHDLVPYLDLRQPWADYFKSRSQKLRKNLKASRRKLESQGEVRLAEHDSLRRTQFPRRGTG